MTKSERNPNDEARSSAFDGCSMDGLRSVIADWDGDFRFKISDFKEDAYGNLIKSVVRQVRRVRRVGRGRTSRTEATGRRRTAREDERNPRHPPALVRRR